MLMLQGCHTSGKSKGINKILSGVEAESLDFHDS